MTRLYSYVVVSDHGFAPNPFHGYCTLANCKPRIRGSAQPGDWILGSASRAGGGARPRRLRHARQRGAEFRGLLAGRALPEKAAEPAQRREPVRR